VYNEVLVRLRSSAAVSPAFEDALWAHFHRLPARSAARSLRFGAAAAAAWGSFFFS
jgi:hypothetical protein